MLELLPQNPPIWAQLGHEPKKNVVFLLGKTENDKYIETETWHPERAEELQNNRVLTYEGCFGFHQVANAKESRLYERA